MTLGRPALHLKLAQTADGFAGRAGDRLLITGAAADSWTHLARAKADAVMIGVGTALADDPRLDVRLPGLEDRSPVRIVIDTYLRTPATARLLTGSKAAPAWVVCGEPADGAAERRLRDVGAEVIRTATASDGRVDLRLALRALADRGLTRVFCEGGPALAEALACADLVDEVAILTGPARLEASGVVAVRPGLTEHLRTGGFTPTERMLGPDRLDRFERASCSLAS